MFQPLVLMTINRAKTYGGLLSCYVHSYPLSKLQLEYSWQGLVTKNQKSYNSTFKVQMCFEQRFECSKYLVIRPTL